MHHGLKAKQKSLPMAVTFLMRKASFLGNPFMSRRLSFSHCYLKAGVLK
jgi:hypothetical protein